VPRLLLAWALVCGVWQEFLLASRQQPTYGGYTWTPESGRPGTAWLPVARVSPAGGQSRSRSFCANRPYRPARYVETPESAFGVNWSSAGPHRQSLTVGDGGRGSGCLGVVRSPDGVLVHEDSAGARLARGWSFAERRDAAGMAVFKATGICLLSLPGAL
jgi:hypothetical protein